VQFKVIDDPSIDTTSRTGKLVMGILALIAEFENDIRHERQMDGIKKARERGTRFGRKPLLVLSLKRILLSTVFWSAKCQQQTIAKHRYAVAVDVG